MTPIAFESSMFREQDNHDESSHCSRRFRLVGTRTARAARKLFGPNAKYTVISVGPSADMSWGEDLMSWGMAYTLAEPPPGYVDGMPLVMHDTASAVRTAQEVADAAELPSTTIIGEEGARARAKIDAAHAHGVDVIFVGSHDRSWFSKLLDPATEATVVRHSDVPVLVAR
jgi:nucleotide-binding universal stress UspA family protein